MKLIHKGGFRERANRQSKYQNSENRQTTLKPNQYQPTTTVDSSEHPQHIDPEHLSALPKAEVVEAKIKYKKRAE